ncbi:MAG: hypothetical protein JO107_08855 [Hyphomicrobiales bacterium]|nr:hypothetical protein [Hyphomicrobiales bacterium]
MTITLNLDSVTLDEGQTVNAGALIASHADSRHRGLTEFAIFDNGADGGHFRLDGHVLPDRKWTTLTAGQLAGLRYVAGPGEGSETVSIRAYDGQSWSSVYSATVTTVAPGPVSLLQDPGIAGDVANLMVNNSLSYDAMLTILQDAAAGGMTQSKFSTLQTLASLLNAPNGITVSSYVQQIADDVINGNSANASWNGGASIAAPLGNLSASSSETQTNELIGKWFLGTDLPSLSLASVGGQNLNPTYVADMHPLYGPSGSPQYTDVNQGYLGDCYLMASLGETALKDPAAIESMITNNGNGTYGVCFEVDGQPDYVTVNDELPVFGGREIWANGSTLEFANGSTSSWSELIEKAYVELNAQTAAAQEGGHSAGDSYAAVTAGTAAALTEITGQSVDCCTLNADTSPISLGSTAYELGRDLAAGDEVLMSTPSNTTGNLVSDHMFEVTGVNQMAGTISLQNPWNTAYSGTLAMSFTESMTQLAEAGVTFYATNGVKAA